MQCSKLAACLRRLVSQITADSGLDVFTVVTGVRPAPRGPAASDLARSRAQSRNISASELTIQFLSVMTSIGRDGAGNSIGRTLSGSCRPKQTIELGRAVTKVPDATSRSWSGSENVAIRIRSGSTPAPRNPCARCSGCERVLRPRKLHLSVRNRSGANETQQAARVADFTGFMCCWAIWSNSARRTCHVCCAERSPDAAGNCPAPIKPAM